MITCGDINRHGLLFVFDIAERDAAASNDGRDFELSVLQRLHLVRVLQVRTWQFAQPAEFFVTHFVFIPIEPGDKRQTMFVNFLQNHRFQFGVEIFSYKFVVARQIVKTV